MPAGPKFRESSLFFPVSIAAQANSALKLSDIGTWSWDIVDNSMTWDNHSLSLFGLPAGTLPTRYEDFLSLLSPEDQ